MELKKNLSMIHIFSIAAGAMISSGLFILPGYAHSQAGPAVVLSYLLAGLLSMTAILSIAEMATAMPRAGGDYFIITRSLGPLTGTVSAILSWLSLSLKSAFALVGMSTFTAMIVEVDPRVAGITLCIFFTLFNIIGVKASGKTQLIMVFGLLALLAFYVAGGIFYVDTTRYQPLAPQGVMAVLSAAGLVFVSYGGLLQVASISEEVTNPSRNIPLGIFLAFGVVSALYVTVVFITSGLLDHQVLNDSLTPLSDGAEGFLGSLGAIALGVAAILAFASTANAGIMSASRYPLGLSRDGLFPGVFSRVHHKFSTPHFSVLVTGLIIIGAILLEFEALVKAASTVMILTYILANLSLVVIRESRLANYWPTYRAPFYPWMQITGIIGFIVLILGMGMEAILNSLLFILAGFLVYIFYGRFKGRWESALTHIMENITDEQLTKGLLEYELKKIIEERDQVEVESEEIIEESLVLDFEEVLSLEEFLEEASAKMSEKMGVSRDFLHVKLLNKCREIIPQIKKNAVILHLSLEEAKKPFMLIARNKKGIKFRGEFPQFKGVIILVGREEDKDLQLRLLYFIQEILQEERFEKMWHHAVDPWTLRSLILLSARYSPLEGHSQREGVRGSRQ
ncbi:MAG: amino acid permease [Candidatus Syntrophonatronum acetioxidans]|uniref:Amino acid permease n=1 Tax=Candidatus Syntrophonatronum acetioxidans TaxID=1795816 RepID=A0A424YDN3_9FIRM|nr:MAG: amino acid permease [Candidatus Syntrophonatronum acetioxidans]